MSTTDLTLEEQATNFATMQHIARVNELLMVVVKELIDRGVRHDRSKLARPEVEAFTAQTNNLAGVTYGTPEYDAQKKAIAPAIAHHYAHNTHHPEHYKNGIEDMNLADIVEMFCDWKAASERHTDGNLRHSIEKNADRFRMSPQLVKIFENSVGLLEG